MAEGKSSKGQAAPDFEQALAEMESIVQKMEGDQLPLRESLDCLKRGMELGKICHSTLDKAEQQVRKLVAKEDGYGLEEFSGDAEGGQDESL